MSKIEQIHQLFLQCSGVSTDTRSIEKDSIFFALKGERFNGNKFASMALESGAKYVVIDEDEYNVSEKCILVDDVLETLQVLARFHRSTLPYPVLGITGSNGKTTTKELLSVVLQQKYKLHATVGNLNNHIGVPLTILSVAEDCDFMIVEMGANHLEEIKFLCNISDPDYGVLTNIGRAHIEGFGGYEGVKKTKLELYDHLRAKNGLVFVNGLDEVLTTASEDMEREFYGTQSEDLKHQMTTDDFGRLRVNLEYRGSSYDIQTNLVGEYNYLNVLVAVSVGLYFEVEITAIVKVLSSYKPSNNRSQLIEKEGNKIIMDAYNANPSSMKLAIDSFDSVKADGRILILGDMLELGVESEMSHLEIVDQIRSGQYDHVYLVGQEFGKLKTEFEHFDNVDDLGGHLKDRAPKKSAILIKGSRGIQLEKVLDYI